MRLPSLASRVAWAQALLSAAALSLVCLATSLGVRTLFMAKADAALHDLMQPIVAYLDQGRTDWQLLAAEIEEIRPRDTAVEVRPLQGGGLLLRAGGRLALEHPARGCSAYRVWRVCTATGRGFRVTAAKNRTSELATTNTLMLTMTGACLIAGIAVAAASGAVTRRALRPLADLRARVAAIVPGAEQTLGRTSRVRELAVLEERFDDLLLRFNAALAREKRFTAHASHELRTPLTIARAEIEDAATGELHERAQRALAALSRLEKLVEVLLWFARAQTRLDGEAMDLVNIADIVTTEIAGLRRTAPARSIAAELPDEALVRGEEQLLARAIANLIDNACRHGDQSPICVRIARHSDALVLEIENGGSGIPAHARESVFEPFFRGPDSAEGFGLGLPFARAVARAHGGDVEFGSRAAGRTEVTLRLPLVAWSDRA